MAQRSSRNPQPHVRLCQRLVFLVGLISGLISLAALGPAFAGAWPLAAQTAVVTPRAYLPFAASGKTTAPTPQPTAPIPTATSGPVPTAPIPTATFGPAPTSAPAPGGALAAFPGAEGFGSQTVGGRGGRIIYVTNLNDAGPGSLRAALESSGPRLVLFQVAGTINLTDDITINQPFLTIAGQSAPGEGVQIKGGMLKIRTHDVVMRYLKLRPGDQQNRSSNNERDAVTMGGNSNDTVYNLVIDHSSMVWGPDVGGPSILTNAKDITIQYSIMGEGLYLSNHSEATPNQGGHALGLNITQLDDSAYPSRLTLHHNLLTTADHRMPQIIGAASVDMVNNVIYNWGTHPAHGNPRSLNLIKNMFIKGPMTKTLLAWEPRGNAESPTLRPNAVYEQGTVTEGFTTVRGEPQTVYAPTRFEPYSMRNEQSPQEAYTQIVQGAGATRPVRDSVDQRIINNLLTRTGQFPNGSDLAWPALATGPLPTDADQDGMPDTWEVLQFGTTSYGSATDSSSDFDRDGYTDVEEYLNGSDPKAP